MSHTYFISDLHLQPETPSVTMAFMAFIRGKAREADALYILGDFFEVWIGDDDDHPFNEQIKTELLRATQSGLTIYIMWGNRDFLIGQQFEQETGVIRINDPTMIECYKKKYLLMHGDSLCIDDHKHQAFRKKTRNPFYRYVFLALPLWLRRRIAYKIRKKSSARNARLPNAIMDSNPQEIDRVLSASGADILIHGHTHRPETTDKKIVLGDWHSGPAVFTISLKK